MVYYSVLKMEAAFSPETSLNVYRITWRCIPKDIALRGCKKFGPEFCDETVAEMLQEFTKYLKY
jgi:hypothetical protein